MNCARSNVYYALQNIGIIHNNLNAADIGLDAARESLAMTQESIGISHESFGIFKGCFHIGDGSRGYGCESLYSGENTVNIILQAVNCCVRFLGYEDGPGNE